MEYTTKRQRRYVPWLALLLLLTPLLAVVRPQPAAAAGVVSQCTETALRNALSGGGLVTFSGCGTIPIASQLVISQNTTIDGGGLVTLDGQDATRLIVVNAGVELELLGLTLTGGAAPAGFEGGGVVLNRGTLTVTASTLSGNRASTGVGGAIYNDGVLMITASTLSGNRGGNGGAIYDNGGVVTITDSTLDGNEAATHGGAIFSFTGGIITIIASTLSGNRAVNRGGAIFTNQNTTLAISASTLSGNNAQANHGGAIFNGGGATLTASTLSGNSANGDGGAIRNEGTLTLTASTLSGNSARDGGAIFSDLNARTTITASTLSGNSAARDAGAIYNLDSVTLTANTLSGSNLCNVPMMSNGYNVASDSTCNLTAGGDVQSTNPLLGNLANNGGPTLTMLPQPGSPAIDRVPNALCATLSAANNGHDQRGAQRPEAAGLPCDSGSVELQVNNFFCVGDRSGALRYVGVPNGCVRGEFRLLPTTEGVYAFCVGDRSGSMRYLMSSAANCLRGEWSLVMPEVSPITICVGERSRSVRYVANAGQCNARGGLPYVIVNPAG